MARPAQPPAPHRRRLVLGALTAAALIFLTGLLVGRAGPRPAQERAAPPAPAPPPSAPTPALGRSARPSRVGALHAARRLVGQMVDERYLTDPAARNALLGHIALPAARAALLARADRTYDYMRDQLALAEDPAQAVLRAAPAGWRLEAYDGRRARVAVWVATVLASRDGGQAIATWSTSHLTLGWTRAGWRLAAAAADEDGPAPAQVTSTPAAPAEFVAQVKRFQGWGG